MATKAGRIRIIVGLFVGITPGFTAHHLFAQSEAPLKPFREGVPVRRAEPIRGSATPEPAPIPGIVDPASDPAPPAPTPPPSRTRPRIVGSVPIPATVPADPVEPRASELPAVRPSVRSTPAAKPTPNPAEMADPTGEIRISPRTTMSAENAQMTIADHYYTTKKYDAAAPEYEKFLQLYPNTNDRQTALFRLAECYRQLGAANAARSTYLLVLDDYANGDFVGPAAYRVAEISYQSKNYQTALPYYRKASVRLRDAKLSNAARYYTARCLEGTGDRIEAREVYRELIAAPLAENPFHEASRHALALLLHQANQVAEAVRQMEALEAQTQNAEVKAEAAVRVGVWLLELEQNAKAEAKLKEALTLPNLGRWQDVAMLGLLQVKYNNERFQEVVDSLNVDVSNFSPDVRPQLLLLVGQSHRRLGRHTEARAMFDKVIADNPNSVFAREAQAERIKCLYYADDTNLVEEIDKYLLDNPEVQKRDEIQLMKAEVLFKRKEFSAAAPIYDILTRSRQLIGSFKAEAYYKGGYCYMETNENDRALKCFSQLLEEFPTYKSAASALALRATAFLRMNNAEGALADLDTLISRFPKAKERERALHQKAIIMGQRNDDAGMVGAYRKLLTDYPETAVKPEANFFIGQGEMARKNYPAAVEPLRIARELDKAQYFEKTSQALMVIHYNMEDPVGLAKEVQTYVDGGGKAMPRYEFLRWIAQTHFDAATSETKPLPAEKRKIELAKAEEQFISLRKRGDAQTDDLLLLGRIQMLLGKGSEAAVAISEYLKTAKDPGPRSRALLILGEAHLAAKNVAGAQRAADEVLTLQQDGEFNAKARVLAGDIQASQGKWTEAAKVYESVSVVIDDEKITPVAMEKAVEAYKKAGSTKDGDRLLNTLKSRYPEYLRMKKPATSTVSSKV